MTTVFFNGPMFTNEKVKIKTPGDKLPKYIMYRGHLFKRYASSSDGFFYRERSLLVIE